MAADCLSAWEASKWIPVIADAVQAIAVVGGIYLAFKQLSAWRVQRLGEKRMELAADILTTADEVVSAIRNMRSPGAFEGEGLTRKAKDFETESIKRIRDSYYVPLERWKTSEDVFKKFETLRPKARVYFEKRLEPYFATLIATPFRIAVASRMLIETADEYGDSDQDRIQRLRASQKKREEIIWDHSTTGQPDELSIKMERALEGFTTTLMPLFDVDRKI